LTKEKNQKKNTVSTYLCKTGFSPYVSTKTKYRNQLDAEPDMKLHLSSVKPNIKEICANKIQRDQQ
jgi:hypothetical protein